jgi:hypothetical protein
MDGYSREYVVQHRLQDYWLDCLNGKFQYLDQAQAALKSFREIRQNTDFRVVKRITKTTDEVIE